MSATDRGYTVERAKSGLGAAEALSVTQGHRDYWEARVRYWREQLRFAETREAVEGAHGTEH